MQIIFHKNVKGNYFSRNQLIHTYVLMTKIKSRSTHNDDLKTFFFLKERRMTSRHVKWFYWKQY